MELFQTRRHISALGLINRVHETTSLNINLL
jgi:hypothetical protein